MLSAPVDDSCAADQRLAAALGQLTADQREVLLLHAWGGLSHEEIAAALQIAPAADSDCPPGCIHVLGAADLLILALTGLGIAAIGALGPATWAATARTATTLRTE